MDRKRDPILITGAARSGVSMIAGVVSLCGAWGGIKPGAADYDGRTSFENSEVAESIVKPFLRGIAADPNGQFPLPDIAKVADVPDSFTETWGRRVHRVWLGQGYAGGPVFYASPRTCLVWPVWHRAFPDAKWVIVRRNDDDIVRACTQTGFMKAHKTDAGWRAWVDVHKQRFDEMIRAGLQVWQIWPQRMIRGHIGELRQLIADHLGLTWDETAVTDFIAPILWKGGVFQIADGKPSDGGE